MVGVVIGQHQVPAAFQTFLQPGLDFLLGDAAIVISIDPEEPLLAPGIDLGQGQLAILVAVQLIE